MMPKQSLQLLIIADISYGKLTTMLIYLFDKRLNSTPLGYHLYNGRNLLECMLGMCERKKEITNAETDGKR